MRDHLQRRHFWRSMHWQARPSFEILHGFLPFALLHCLPVYRGRSECETNRPEASNHLLTAKVMWFSRRTVMSDLIKFLQENMLRFRGNDNPPWNGCEGTP